MAIRYIQYQAEEFIKQSICGYSLYINHRFHNIYESIKEVRAAANRYAKSNKVEIYPVMKRRQNYEQS